MDYPWNVFSLQKKIIMNQIRCPWANPKNTLYITYHDTEWGREVHDDRLLFEMLILEGAQAWLSWETVLKKRQNYKELFDNFDVQKIIHYDEKKIAKLLLNPGIIRNKLKVTSVIKNAKVFISLQKDFWSFDAYIWSFVNDTPIQNRFKTMADYIPKSAISDQISKDLKKRGMSFVGSTIIYAFMQAVWMTNDHIVDCFCYKK